jgi:succinate dehydrogenase / fumarate reductase membrane anchor subunit
VVNRIIVGAHYGLKDWLAQRVTALVMIAYTVIFLVALGRGTVSYASWKALFAQEWMRFATFLFVASVLIHAWVGVRNIWMDYIKHTGLRLALQVATILWLVGCAGWAMQILWRA